MNNFPYNISKSHFGLITNKKYKKKLTRRKKVIKKSFIVVTEKL
jgi:hypothetical protein